MLRVYNCAQGILLFLYKKFCIKEERGHRLFEKGFVIKDVQYLGPSCFFCRLLLSLDRRNGVEEARDTLALAEQYMKFPGNHQAKVVGVDLSGDVSL